MNSKLIGIIADDGVDTSLLAWAIYYLAKQEKYFYCGFDFWFDVAKNPIDEFDPTGLIQVETDGVYSVPELDEKLAQFNSLEEDCYKILITRISHVTGKDPEFVAKFSSSCEKIFLISSFNKPNLYRCKDTGTVDDLISKYFADSVDKWETGISEIWDYRELLSLNFAPFQKFDHTTAIDLSTPHFPILYSEYYTGFERLLISIAQYLKIKVDEEDIANICEVYNKWRTSKIEQIAWNDNFYMIVDYIVKGYGMDLSRFNLDIVREAAIMNELACTHKLGIKSWGLKQLPSNTLEIHNLLEPLVHEIPQKN